MALCEVISEAAASIARGQTPMSAREAYLSFVLQGMPYFRDVRRLDIWEWAYKQVAPDEDLSKTEQLFDELFDLGCYNLYGAFSPKQTQQSYEQLLDKFAALGVALPRSADVSNW